jgi:hypothetical protein
MARGTAHGYGSMNTGSLRKFLVALQAVLICGNGRGSDEQGGEKNEQKDY